MNLAKTPYSTDRWLNPLKLESRYPDWDEAFEMASMQYLLSSIVRPIRSVVLFRVGRAEAIAQGQFIHGFPFQPVSPISLLRLGSSSLASLPSSPSMHGTLPLSSETTNASSMGSPEAETRPGLSNVVKSDVEMDKNANEPERKSKRARKSTKPSRRKSTEEPDKQSKRKGRSKQTTEPVQLSDDLAAIPEKPRLGRGSNQGRNSETYLELKTINGFGPYVYERQYIDGVYKSRYKGKEGQGTKQQRQRDQPPKPVCPDCGSDKTVSNGTDRQRGKRCYKCTYCLHRWRVPLDEN